MSMNIHHLELFYYVARHGGIAEAVRNMPYGIQQPAVSAQILQLEDYLGVSLFQRRPFCLTPAGDKPVTLKDTKEAGLCSLRLPKPISDNPTLTNAAGQTGEKDTWGKPAPWCDISGQINGKPYGVAVLDHPSNPRHPTRWHVREYGLLSANPFGLHDYDKKANPPGAGNRTAPARRAPWGRPKTGRRMGGGRPEADRGGPAGRTGARFPPRRAAVPPGWSGPPAGGWVRSR